MRWLFLLWLLSSCSTDSVELGYWDYTVKSKPIKWQCVEAFGRTYNNVTCKGDIW